MTVAAPVHFRVTVDGKSPLGDHGTDIDEHRNGTSMGFLYQLVRQTMGGKPRLVEIEFQDAGALAYVVTFG